jgi:hypothetical protein
MNSENTSRLLLGLIEGLKKTPEEVEAVLKSLTLRIVATPAVATSAAAQAGLLTAINTARRCFLGGVRVEGLDKLIDLKVPYAPFRTLNEVVAELLPTPLVGESFVETIFVGGSTERTGSRDWVMHCGGWRGGVTVGRVPIPFYQDPTTDFALGGVYAGGLAVHHAFFRAAQFSHRLEEPHGISLWNLDEKWSRAAGDGPPLDSLPSALWLIGLGHLGQAYLWTLGLLPFSNPTACQLMLQDIDALVEANEGAALLAQAGDRGKRKTRLCRDWLDARGFTNTLVCDRTFDTRTYRCDQANRREPPIALCGLDNIPGRRHLGDANFLHVLECGLGGSAADFDQIGFHSFPNQNTVPAKLWAKDVPDEANPTRQKILEKKLGTCGAVPLATAAISSSFVGAVAASLVVAELLRMYHGGKQCWDGDVSLRSPTSGNFKLEPKPYDAVQIARYGVIHLP